MVTRAGTKSPILLFAMLFVTTLLWGWAIPAAYFWNRAKAQGILLPHVPRLFWLPPGELWSHAPVLFIAFLLLAPFAIYFVMVKKRAFLKLIITTAAVIFLIAMLINLVWGVALLSQI